MRRRPLSRQRSATFTADTGLVDPTAFRFGPGANSDATTLLGFLPFAALILPDRVKHCFHRFRPRLPLNERPPRCFLFEGSAAIYVRSSPDSKRSTDHGHSFRLPGCALRQAEDADPGSIAPSLLPWDSPVSGIRTPESARDGILNPIDRQPLRFLTTRSAIRSWA
jgi:hypothetical protein